MLPVPSNRLLTCLLGVAALAALAGPLPAVTAFWIIALLLVIVIALVDLGWSLRSGLAVTASLPPVVRFSKDRPGIISVTFSNPLESARRIRFALGLPEIFVSQQEDTWIDLPGGTKLARVDWTATPRARGRFTEVLACIEIQSTLGFWTLRTRRACRSELRVYPNLFSERKQLAAVFLSRGQSGAKLQRTVGRGRDFEKLRDYLPGDGFDEIHWKATAKRGRPITKVFQAERTQEIYLVIDASRLSARRVVHEGITQTALERYLTATLILLLAAERQGDRFGLLVYDDRVRTYLKAGYGDSHYGACREAIYGLQPSEATPDITEIVRYLRTNLRRRSLLFFLTDLTDPVLAEDFTRHAELLARQHLVMVNQLRAPDVAPLFSSGEVTEPNEIYRKLAGHARWQEAQGLARTLKPLGITANLLEDETMAAQLVTQYLAVKRRQLL